MKKLDTLHPRAISYVRIISLLGFLGVIDAGYVTYLYWTNTLPLYTLSALVDCGNVLRSQFSTVFGIPLTTYGLIHFILVLFFWGKAVSVQEQKWIRLLFLQTALGVISAVYTTYLQLGLIQAVCGYTSLAILLNIALYFLVRKHFQKEHKEFRAYKRALIKKYLFGGKNTLSRTPPHTPRTRIRSRK